MLDKYTIYTNKTENKEKFISFGEPFDKDLEVDRINKKYIANLGDKTEIQKNRELIDELRSNLR